MKRHSHSLYTAASFSVSSFYSRHLTRSPRLTINKHPAFTIVELLIVIVIIGILAAITVVAYRGITNRANASVASQALSEAKRKLLLYQVDNTTWPTTLSAADIKESNNLTYQYSYNNTTTPATYCLTATVKNTSYKLDSTSQTPTAGGCAGHGQGGQGAITNLMTNPSFESGMFDVGQYNSTRSQSSTWSSSGSNSLAITPSNTNADSHISIGGNVGGLRLGMQTGKTYTVQAVLRVPAPLTGTLDGRALTILVYEGQAGGYRTHRVSAPNATGTYPLTLTFSVDATSSEAAIRFYNGGAQGAGTVYYDSIMLTEGSSTYNYADGNSTDWVWNGTPNSSTSTGPAQ